jgi:hypothetical protein
MCQAQQDVVVVILCHVHESSTCASCGCRWVTNSTLGGLIIFVSPQPVAYVGAVLFVLKFGVF